MSGSERGGGTMEVMATATLSEFRNEPYADFSLPENRRAMEAALARVRSAFGREYPLHLAGETIATGDKLVSVNPSRPDQAVGIHHKASRELAARAVESACAFFPEWSRTPARERVRMLLEAARILRARKFEFDAWLVYEAGKTWPEAEADVSEAIDFCEYYAREMMRLAGPQPVAPASRRARRDALHPAGRGRGDSAVEFSAGHPGRHDGGGAGDRQHGGHEAFERNAHHRGAIRRSAAAKPAFRSGRFTLLTGSGAAVGDVLVEHPKTRFISFTGSRDVGLRINELAAKHQPGQIWIKRVVAEMGGKDAIIVDGDADLDKAVDGVLASAFGYQGQKCSACSRAIVDARSTTSFWRSWRPRRRASGWARRTIRATTWGR